MFGNDGDIFLNTTGRDAVQRTQLSGMILSLQDFDVK